MGQKVVESCAHLQQLSGRSFPYDIICCDRDKCLPIWRRDGSAVRHFFTIVVHLLGLDSHADPWLTNHLLLRINRLEHEQCPAQVPTALLCNSLIQAISLGPSLPLCSDSKCRTDIILSRCSHPDQQGT